MGDLLPEAPFGAFLKEGAADDAAVCCVGVRYLQRPVEVFEDVRRVLRPAAPFIVSCSNRCFPTKAVRIWRGLDAEGYAAPVRLYLKGAAFTDIRGDLLQDGVGSYLLVAMTARPILVLTGAEVLNAALAGGHAVMWRGWLRSRRRDWLVQGSGALTV